MERYERPQEVTRPVLAAELYDVESIRQQAWELIRNRQEIVHDNWELEPEVNSRSALFEALKAKGHLSVIESDEPIHLTNQRTLQRLINGWLDNLPQWEKDRRFSEIVEELINHQVSQDVAIGNLPSDTLIITISNIPKDLCGDELALSGLGYGVLNDKGMVRATSFENDARIVEQVSRSNSADSSAHRFFGSQGYVVGYGSDRILSNQIIATKRDFPDGVIDVQRALDHLAGPDIIYGEYRFQAGLDVPEYEDLREVSAARENQAEKFIKKLADFERNLNVDYKAGKISYEQKLAILHQRRKEVVAEVCLLEPGYAKDAMGEAAAKHIIQASYAMASGNDAAGTQYMERALATADPRAGTVCGGSGEANQASHTVNSSEAKRLLLEAKEERKNWKWNRGICVVKECPTRPAKTDVGPCSVCRGCQTIFDRGNKPSSVYKAVGFIDSLFESLAEFNRDYDLKQEAKRLKKAA